MTAAFNISPATLQPRIRLVDATAYNAPVIAELIDRAFHLIGDAAPMPTDATICELLRYNNFTSTQITDIWPSLMLRLGRART